MSWVRWIRQRPAPVRPEPFRFEEPEAPPRRSFLAPGAPPAAGFSEAPIRELAGLRPAESAVSRPAAPRAEAALLARLLALVLPGGGEAEAGAAIQRFGTFASVLSAPEAELREVPGLGTHSVAAIKLVHAAALRLARAAMAEQAVLDSRDRLHAYLSAVLAHERIEQFRILFLDENGMLRADEVQGTGTVNHTPVYPREVVRRALELQAASLVLVHNHPSGDPTPSRDDVEMTASVQAAARALSVVVRDHIIVGAGRWVSMAEAGLM